MEPRQTRGGAKDIKRADKGGRGAATKKRVAAPRKTRQESDSDIDSDDDDDEDSELQLESDYEEDDEIKLGKRKKRSVVRLSQRGRDSSEESIKSKVSRRSTRSAKSTRSKVT